MRFFIISLCINLILLAIPLKGFNVEIKKPKENSVKVVLNELEKPKEEAKEQSEPAEEPKVEEEQVEEEPEEIPEPSPKPQEPVKPKKKPVKKPVKKPSENKKPTQEKVEKTSETKESKPTTSNQKSDEFVLNDSFCRANVKIDEIDDSYPKKAKMLKKLGAFEVSVRFKIEGNSLKILNISGDKLFVEHTRKLFKKLGFKVKDKRANDCTFVKVIKYELK